jgi:hypothetical protein
MVVVGIALKKMIGEPSLRLRDFLSNRDAEDAPSTGSLLTDHNRESADCTVNELMSSFPGKSANQATEEIT